MFAPMALDFAATLGTEVQLCTKGTFQEFAGEMTEGSYDIVLVHPFLYIDGHAAQRYSAVARVDQELRAVIVSRGRPPIATIADLRGETLALPPRGSGVSYLIRLAMLDEGLVDGVDLHLHHHQTKVSCLHAVAAGQAIGCVVPSFLGSQLAAMDEMSLEPIWTSEPITSLVVAVHPRLQAAAVERLQRRVLSWRTTADGRALLDRLAWPALAAAGDHDYDALRLVAGRLRGAASG